MNLRKKIHVAGHRGLVGSAVVRRLRAEGADNLLLRTSSELDLTDQAATEAFFAAEKPDYVILCAAKVGGIHANSTRPAEFIRDNLAIQTNVIHSAWKHGAKKLLFLGSSCIYPKLAPQPIREDALLTGPLEHTNQAYAIAKIAGLEMCRAYRKEHGFDAVAAMPTNLYGFGDNFHPEDSHVLPGLIRRLYDAKINNTPEVSIWGTGTPLRELLHADDLADALIFLMRNYSDVEIVNVGSGEETSIKELAKLIAALVDYNGTLRFDTSRPDGTPRKLLDSTRILRMGWRPKIGLAEGIRATLADYVARYGAR